MNDVMTELPNFRSTFRVEVSYVIAEQSVSMARHQEFIPN